MTDETLPSDLQQPAPEAPAVPADEVPAAEPASQEPSQSPEEPEQPEQPEQPEPDLLKNQTPVASRPTPAGPKPHPRHKHTASHA